MLLLVLFLRYNIKFVYFFVNYYFMKHLSIELTFFCWKTFETLFNNNSLFWTNIAPHIYLTVSAFVVVNAVFCILSAKCGSCENARYEKTLVNIFYYNYPTFSNIKDEIKLQEVWFVLSTKKGFHSVNYLKITLRDFHTKRTQLKVERNHLFFVAWNKKPHIKIIDQKKQYQKFSQK